jgi:hypothetical protein
MNFILPFSLVLVVVAVIGVVGFRRQADEGSARNFDLANAALDRRDHRQACYRFVLTVGTRYDRSGDCKKKVKELWDAFGPFEFDDLIDEDLSHGTALFEHGSDEESSNDTRAAVARNLKSAVGL